jgi:lysosomal acid lipase/cholesteryl ester hydrolase
MKSFAYLILATLAVSKD